MILSADFARRIKTEKTLEALRHNLTIAEAEDKAGFEEIWANHVAASPIGGELRLYEALAKLDQMCRDEDGKLPSVKQPDYFKDLATMSAIANANNDFIHDTIRKLVNKCGGHYDAGPVKLGRRIQAKANNDYNGDISKVIDPVRGSGMFDNIEGYTRAVEILIEGGPDVPVILRFKDRVTKPLANSYRDVLMNLTVHGTDGELGAPTATTPDSIHPSIPITPPNPLTHTRTSAQPRT